MRHEAYHSKRLFDVRHCKVRGKNEGRAMHVPAPPVQYTCSRMFSSFMSLLITPFLWQKSVPMMMCWKNHLHTVV